MHRDYRLFLLLFCCHYCVNKSFGNIYQDFLEKQNKGISIEYANSTDLSELHHDVDPAMISETSRIDRCLIMCLKGRLNVYNILLVAPIYVNKDVQAGTCNSISP